MLPGAKAASKQMYIYTFTLNLRVNALYLLYNERWPVKETTADWDCT